MSELRGPRCWLTAAFAGAATAASVAGLTSVLDPGRWIVVAVGMIAVLCLVTSALRTVSRSVQLPTIVGVVVTGWTLVVLYAGTAAGSTLVPTPSAFRDLRGLVHDAITFARETSAPAPAIRPIEMLVVAGGCLVYLAMEALAVGWTMGALAGLPLLAMWAPIMVVGFPVPWWAFLTAGVCWLLILAIARERGPTEPRFERRGLTRLVVPAAAVAAAALAIGPIASAAPGWGALPRPGGVGAGSNGTLRLALGLDLRDNLRDRSNVPLITYHTRLLSIGTLRLYTLTTFDGLVWQRESSAGLGSVPLTNTTLWPEALPYIVPGEVRENNLIDITIGALDESRLPIPGEPRVVSAPGSWSYDPARDEVIGLDRGTKGLTYQVEFQARFMTADGLRAADGAGPANPDQYLAMPITTNRGHIVDLARKLTEGATTRYDQAMALQTYLRNSNLFTYDTRVQRTTSDDAVWDFLQNRHGYCVQFSSAMVMMARALQIPARLGVGFLQGAPGREHDSFVITGRQAHSWPELYFPGYGWVRFEPTPAEQTGAPPSWASPFGENLPVPDSQKSASAIARRSAPASLPTSVPGAVTQGFGIGGTRVPLGAVLGAGLALLVLAGLLARRLFRAAHTRRVIRTLTPEMAWSRLRDRLREHGIAWRDSTTPRQAAAFVERTITAREGVTWGSPASGALHELARAVEDARYSPRQEEWPAGELETRIVTVLRVLEVRDRVHADAGPSAPRADA